MAPSILRFVEGAVAQKQFLRRGRRPGGGTRSNVPPPPICTPVSVNATQIEIRSQRHRKVGSKVCANRQDIGDSRLEIWMSHACFRLQVTLQIQLWL